MQKIKILYKKEKPVILPAQHPECYSSKDPEWLEKQHNLIGDMKEECTF